MFSENLKGAKMGAWIGFDSLILKILKKNKNSFLAECIRSGNLEKNKGVHLSNRKIKLNYLTEKRFKG